jgi:hypothetical protein
MPNVAFLTLSCWLWKQVCSVRNFIVPTKEPSNVLGFAIAAFVAIFLNLTLSEEIESEELEPEDTRGENKDGEMVQAENESKDVEKSNYDEKTATQLPD